MESVILNIRPAYIPLIRKGIKDTEYRKHRSDEARWRNVQKVYFRNIETGLYELDASIRSFGISNRVKVFCCVLESIRHLPALEFKNEVMWLVDYLKTPSGLTNGFLSATLCLAMPREGGIIPVDGWQDLESGETDRVYFDDDILDPNIL